MSSPNALQREAKNHHKEDSNKTKKYSHLNQQHLLNFYSNFDNSCLSDFVLLRLIGVDMPPVHRNNYQTREPRGVGYWRHQYLNGLVLPLLPNVLPFYHSPNMVPNAQKKVYYWNRKDTHKMNFRDDKVRDPVHEYTKTGGGFSSPVPRKRHLLGMMENSVVDDSSEDSFQSTASDNGKNMRRIYGPTNNKGNRTNNSVYYYHNNHRPEHLPYRRHFNGQNYGERRYSGRHSPVEYPSQNNHRNHYEDQCLRTKSHSDMFSNYGNNYNNMKKSEPSMPDRFLSRSHLIEATWSHASIKTLSEWYQLSSDIYSKFLANQQTESVFRSKMILWKEISTEIKFTFPGYQLYLIGSTMNGFGSNKSDVDMCLMVGSTVIRSRLNNISNLSQISRALGNRGNVNRIELIHAKVPILKFKSLGFEVDLSCNNAVGIRNTHLLYCYSQLDWRVRPLVLIVKLWAARNNINNARDGTISSYSLSLMVIYYLQCGVHPPVLPCLQQMYRDKFRDDSNITDIDMHEKLDPYTSKNEQELGELLVGFLKYYSEFQFSEYAISIRLATKLKISDCKYVRNSKNDPFEWNYLCIEEPFDLTNAARSVHKYYEFRRIQNTFSVSYETVKKTRNLSALLGNSRLH